MGVRIARRPQRRLVGPHELGDRKRGFPPARQKLGPRAKRIGKQRSWRRRVVLGAVADDEPAANREPCFVGERPALFVARDEPHCVGMFWRGRQRVERNRALGVEGNGAPPGEVEPLRLAHRHDERLGGVEIDGFRRFAAQAQDHRFVRGVAFSGEGERAQKRDLERGDAVDRACLDQSARECRGGFHRPDRMRRRGTDADLEQFEDADHRWNLEPQSSNAAPPYVRLVSLCRA